MQSTVVSALNRSRFLPVVLVTEPLHNQSHRENPQTKAMASEV